MKSLATIAAENLVAAGRDKETAVMIVRTAANLHNAGRAETFGECLELAAAPCDVCGWARYACNAGG